MTKRIEIYFTNENDAESANLKLETLRVSNNFIDEMPGDTEQKQLYVPFATTNLGSTGTPGMINPIGVAAVNTKNDQPQGSRDSNEDKITHMLQFDIVAEDYDEALAILNEFDCYMNNES